MICLGRAALNPPRPTSLARLPSSLIPGRAAVRSRARARPAGHQDRRRGQWKEGPGRQSSAGSWELSGGGQGACREKRG